MRFLFKNLLSLLVLIAPAARGQEQYFALEKLSPTVNSGSDEIAPVPSRDGKTLFFTRMGHDEFEQTLISNGQNLSMAKSRSEYLKELASIFASLAGAPVDDPVKSPFNQDVWFAKTFDGKSFEPAQHASPPLNNALPNSVVAVTPDPNEFLIVNQFPPDGGMEKGFSKIRRVMDDVWTLPQPIQIQDFYTITSEVSLTMSLDGEILILSATRSDSRGDMDLYVCFRESDDRWSAPKPLGPQICSANRETTPFLSEDNRTLYFSSNRPGTMGGSDIFMSRRLDDTWLNWSAPVPLAEPINSVADDSQPNFNMTTGYIYFSSKRDGSSDIFRVQIAPPQPTELTVTGRIVNAGTGQTVKDAIVWYGAPGRALKPLVCPEGQYELKLPKGVRFDLIAEKNGYTGQRQEAFFKSDQNYFQKEYVIDLTVEPLQAGSTIRLNPIYFEQSKAAILPKSYAELERLHQILKENPSLVIRVEGHTDNQGLEADLQRLSEDRAAAIKAFLVDRGIQPERVLPQGFGSKKPVNVSNSEAARAENRRVEFRVVKV